MIARTIIAVTVALSSAALAAVHAETLQEKLDREKAAVDSLNAMLEKTREVLSETEKRKMTTGARLDRLQQDAASTKRELRGLTAKEQSLAIRVNRTRSSLVAAERRLEERRDEVADRLRTTYKLARRDPLAVLFSGASMSEGLRRLKYLGLAARQDRVDAAALAASREEVRRTLRLRQIQHAQQQTLVRATQSKEAELRSTMTEYDGRLKQLTRKETLLRAARQEYQAQLEESQNRMGEIIKELERQRLAGRRLAALPDFDFAGHRGSLPWPVKGRVLTRFGRVKDPDLGTVTMNRGITIGAPEGADVLAIAPGEVMLIDWWRGYGQLVLLRHNDGYYTLYSHLDSRSVEVGEILAEGALIGTVGATGRLDNVPQLHFEIMKEEEVLNPADWLE